MFCTLIILATLIYIIIIIVIIIIIIIIDRVAVRSPLGPILAN